MHLRFDAASAVVSAPTSPQGAAQILLRTDRFVSGNRSGARRLAGLGILARRDHGTGASGGNRLVAFTRVICPISCDAADVLIGRDLVQKLWQHGSISDVAAGDLACRLAAASKPSPDQTKSTTIRAASSCHCKTINSWSCTS